MERFGLSFKSGSHIGYQFRIDSVDKIIYFLLNILQLRKIYNFNPEYIKIYMKLLYNITFLKMLNY